jgi:hypothetical protein
MRVEARQISSVTSPNYEFKRGSVAIAFDVEVWAAIPLCDSRNIRCVLAMRIIRWISASGTSTMLAISANDASPSSGKFVARLKR